MVISQGFHLRWNPREPAETSVSGEILAFAAVYAVELVEAGALDGLEELVFVL